jgi:hypothetical protein
MTVNLSMFAGVGAQIFDNNGVPLAGGKIFSYQAGTTTPQTTYTTSAGNVAHTNPIILDSAGRISSGGEIWLTDAQNYKFVLKTSADVEIATYDNVNGNGSGIFAALAAANGATLVGFTGFNTTVGTVASLAGNSGSDFIGFLQSGANAVAISAQNKMRQIINVKDFGAVGDGITNDATAINNAINYAITVPNSKLVFAPGTYLVDSVLGPYVANDLEIDFGGAKLDFSNVQTSTFVRLLSFEGTYTATSAVLTSGLGINQQTVACSTTGFAAGDMVRIYSDTIWDSTRTSTRIGELNFVESVASPTSLTIVCPA